MGEKITQATEDLKLRRANAEALRILKGDRHTPRTGETLYFVDTGREELVEVLVTSVSMNGSTVWVSWKHPRARLSRSRFFRRYRSGCFRWFLEGRQDLEHTLMSKAEARRCAGLDPQ